MNNEEITILIENYLDGELSGQEKQQFVLDLKTNKELVKELMIHEAIRSTIGDTEFIDLREKLEKIRHEHHKKETTEKRKRQVAIYSFSVLITVIIASTVFFYDKNYTNSELYNMYYQHYDAGTITRGEVKPTKEIYINALRDYDNGKYSEAIKQFNQIADTSVCYIQKEFFTALSCMELKNYTEAIKHFEAAQKDNQSIYYQSIIWYSGLCYLKTNQTEKAKQQLMNLKNSSTNFHKSSEKILKNFH